MEGSRHKSLQWLYEKDARKGLPAASIDKIARIPRRLDLARKPQEMNQPSWKPSLLEGDYKELWAVRMTRNWQVVFRFHGSHARAPDLVDHY